MLARFPGARTAKVKVAEPGQTLADDVARVNAVRALVPTVRVDANGGWTVEEAVAAAAALTADGPLEYLEQPCATVPELAEVRRRVDVPVAADESIRKADDPLHVVRAGGRRRRGAQGGAAGRGVGRCWPSPSRSTFPSWCPAPWTRRSASGADWWPPAACPTCPTRAGWAPAGCSSTTSRSRAARRRLPAGRAGDARPGAAGRAGGRTRAEAVVDRAGPRLFPAACA